MEMQLTEKVAYIKGLMEGMKFDTETNEGKIITALVSLVDDMAHQVEELDDDMDSLYEEVDAVSEDLSDVEDLIFDDDDEDEDEQDDNLYEITCPNCGEVVCVDEEMLCDENLSCPNCATPFEVEFSDCDCGCNGECDCGCCADEETAEEKKDEE